MWWGPKSLHANAMCDGCLRKSCHVWLLPKPLHSHGTSGCLCSQATFVPPASPLFRREGDLHIPKFLKDCWMKPTLEHNTGPVSPDCMGYKCQEYIVNKPQASCVVEGSRCCYREALHLWISWGLMLDAKEVHTRFPLFPENRTLQFGVLWKGLGEVTIPPGSWSGIFGSQ